MQDRKYGVIHYSRTLGGMPYCRARRARMSTPPDDPEGLIVASAGGNGGETGLLPCLKCKSILDRSRAKVGEVPA